MTLTDSSFIKGAALLAVLLSVLSPAIASDVAPFKLGGGYPSLHIIYDSTNRYVVYLDNEYLGYLDKQAASGEDTNNLAPAFQVALERNYSLKKNFRDDSLLPDIKQLFPFDDQTAFTCQGMVGLKPASDYEPRTSQVLSISDNGIVMSSDVDALARARYGLATNQMFLGKIGMNIYYFEPSALRRVYFRAVGARNGTYYFELPRGVTQVFGATRAASANKDVGFWGVRKTRIHFLPPSPVDGFFLEMSFKDAKEPKRAR